jgi:hypothetical protein
MPPASYSVDDCKCMYLYVQFPDRGDVPRFFGTDLSIVVAILFQLS